MLTLCFVSKTYAAKDPEVFVEFDGFTSGIFVGAEKEVKDPVYYTSQQQYIDDVTKDKYLNTIALFINESGIAFMQSDFTCKITIEFTYDDVAGQVHAPQSIDLIVTYKLGQGIKYDARQYYYFYDARKVNVKITAIDNYNASWDILKVLRLESRLSATRDYKFNCTASVNYDNISATADQVDVKWLFPSENGATHFDLEWAWIYEEAADLYKSMVNGQLQFDEKLIFRKNASRVTLVKVEIFTLFPYCMMVTVNYSTG